MKSESKDLNIKPAWLEEALKETPPDNTKYVPLIQVARLIGASPRGFKEYVQRKGIKIKRRPLGSKGSIMYCVTEEEAKEIVKMRIKDGYKIKR